MEIGNQQAEHILQATTTTRATIQELGDRTMQACMTAWVGMDMKTVWQDMGVQGMATGANQMACQVGGEAGLQTLTMISWKDLPVDRLLHQEIIPPWEEILP